MATYNQKFMLDHAISPGADHIVVSFLKSEAVAKQLISKLQPVLKRLSSELTVVYKPDVRYGGLHSVYVYGPLASYLYNSSASSSQMAHKDEQLMSLVENAIRKLLKKDFFPSSYVVVQAKR